MNFTHRDISQHVFKLCSHKILCAKTSFRIHIYPFVLKNKQSFATYRGCHAHKKCLPLSVRTPNNGPSEKIIRINPSVVLNEGKSDLDVCYDEKLSADHPTLGVHISQVVSRKRPVCEAEFVTIQDMGWSFISLIANGFQMRKIKFASVTNFGGKLSSRSYCNFNDLIGVS